MKRETNAPRLINSLLFVVVLVLLNLIASELDLRADLTSNDRYSLSPASVQTLGTVEDTLRVRLFFSDALPPPYDRIPRYAENLLRAYQRNNSRFSFSAVDMGSEAGREEAERLGVQPVQIQRLSDERRESQRVYLGAVVDYAGMVETITPIRGEQGLEYRITAAIERLRLQREAYNALSRPLTARLFISPSLKALDIRGLELVPQIVEGVFERNAETAGLSYELIRVEPTTATEFESARELYGLPRVSWDAAEGGERVGMLGVVIEGTEGFEAIPLRIVRTQDGFGIEDLNQLPSLLIRSINSLVGVLPKVGYSVGHGEPSIADRESGAGLFRAILSERYRIVPQDLEQRPVEEDLEVLIVNGPVEPFSRDALDRLKAFLDRGGSLFVAVDPYTIPPDAPEDERNPWVENAEALRVFLAERGAEVKGEIVLDAQNYVGSRGQEQRPLFQAPYLTGSSLSRENPITRNLENLILFNASVVETTAAEGAQPEILLQSSSRSWASEAIHRIGPWIEAIPPTAELDSYPLSVLSELSGGGAMVVLGTSAITSPPLLEAADKLPNRVFLQNSLDYLHGAPGFALLRSKGLTEPRLPLFDGGTRLLVRIANAAIPLSLLLLLGALLFVRRRIRQRQLVARYGKEER